MVENNVKKLLESGGSKVIAPTKENVTKLLKSGGSQTYTAGGSDYNPDRFKPTPRVTGGRLIGGGDQQTSSAAPPTPQASTPEPEKTAPSPTNAKVKTSQPPKLNDINRPKTSLSTRTAVYAAMGGDQPYYKQSVMRSTGQAIKAAGRNVKRFFTGLSHEYESLTAPFKYSEEKLKDLETSIPTSEGTKIEGTKPFQTFGDLQKKIEQKRAVEIRGAEKEAQKNVQEYAKTRQEAYQKELDAYAASGASQKDINAMARRYETMLKKDIGSQAAIHTEALSQRVALIYGANPDIPKVYERTGGATMFTESLGTLIGSTVSTAATGSPTPFLMLKGARLTSQGSKQDVYLVEKKKYGYNIPTDQPIKKQSGKTKAGGAFFAAAAAYSISDIARIQKAAIIESIEEGRKASSVSVAKPTYQKGEETGITFQQLQKTSEYQFKSSAEIPVFKGEGGRLIFGQADIDYTEIVKDFPKQDWITLNKGTVKSFGGADIVNIDGMGVEKAFRSASTIIMPDKSLTTIDFGGVSKPSGDDLILSRGGKLIYGARKTAGFINFEDLSSGLSKNAPITTPVSRYGLSDYGVFINKAPENLPGLDSDLLGFQGGGAKSSPEFLKQLYKLDISPASQVGNQIAKAIQDSSNAVSSVMPSASLSGSAFAGLGIYERTGSFGRSKPKMANLIIKPMDLDLQNIKPSQKMPVIDLSPLFTKKQQGFSISPISASSNKPITATALNNEAASIFRSLQAQPYPESSPLSPFGGLGFPAGAWGRKPKAGGAVKLQKLSRTPRKFKPKYTASFGAAAFDLSVKATKKQLKDLEKYEYTGFETRPLIELIKPKKKKKKK